MKVLIVILSLLVFSQPTFGQTSDKEEAKEFATEIVATYFDFECTSFLELWNDSIIVLNPYNETVVSTVDFFSDTVKICRKFDRVRFDSTYTFEQYLEEYEIRLYSKEEFTGNALELKEEDVMLSEIFKLYGNSYPDRTYFFSGWYRKNYLEQMSAGEPLDEQRIEHYRSWVMLIGKTPKGWKILGTLP